MNASILCIGCNRLTNVHGSTVLHLFHLAIERHMALTPACDHLDGILEIESQVDPGTSSSSIQMDITRSHAVERMNSSGA
jgi:hypothetical protein